jgi:hypothetical protein
MGCQLTPFLKPLLKNVLIDHLNDMNQKCIRDNHSRQESLKLMYRGDHTESFVELGNVRHSHDETTNKSGQHDNKERCP